MNMSLTETPTSSPSRCQKKTRSVVSVIQLMATISYFTLAQPPSVCKVQVRFIVSRLKTNGNSPRATHTAHWAVGPSTLSELPAEASEQENWGEDCAQVTVSQPEWCITRTPLWASKSWSDQTNIWCSGSSLNLCCFHCGAGLIWLIQCAAVRWVELNWIYTSSSLLHHFWPLGGSRASEIVTCWAAWRRFRQSTDRYNEHQQKHLLLLA